jgi:hypothetical protein
MTVSTGRMGQNGSNQFGDLNAPGAEYTLSRSGTGGGSDLLRSPCGSLQTIAAYVLGGATTVQSMMLAVEALVCLLASAIAARLDTYKVHGEVGFISNLKPKPNCTFGR